ncbi:MAG: hypothetical protein ACRCU1_02780 [Alsobacter sp.]
MKIEIRVLKRIEQEGWAWSSGPTVAYFDIGSSPSEEEAKEAAKACALQWLKEALLELEGS